MQAYAYKPKKNLGTPLVEQTPFNIMMGHVIFANAIFIGIDCDADALPDINKNTLKTVDSCFLAIYIVEMITRFFYLGFERYIKDGFNVLDGFLVIVGVIEKMFFGEGMEAADVMRVLKIMRLIRLTKLLRLVRFFRNLMQAVQGVGRCINTLTSLLPVMGILVYVFGLFGCNTIGVSTAWIFTDRYSPQYEHFENYDHFGTVGRSMLSMFQIITLSGWAEMCRSVMDKFPQGVIFFIAFVFLLSFGLSNVLVGTVCFNSIHNADEAKKKDAEQEYERSELLLEKITDCFKLADTDDSGELDYREMQVLFERPAIRRAFQIMGMPAHDMTTLLKLLDKDGDGQISRQEFTDGFLQFMGGNKTSLPKVQLALQALTLRVADFYNRLQKVKNTMLDQETKLAVAYEAIKEMVSAENHDASLAIRKRKMQHREEMAALIAKTMKKLNLAKLGAEYSSSSSESGTTQSEDSQEIQNVVVAPVRKLSKQVLLPTPAPPPPHTYKRQKPPKEEPQYDIILDNLKKYSIPDPQKAIEDGFKAGSESGSEGESISLNLSVSQSKETD